MVKYGMEVYVDCSAMHVMNGGQTSYEVTLNLTTRGLRVAGEASYRGSNRLTPSSIVKNLSTIATGLCYLLWHKDSVGKHRVWTTPVLYYWRQAPAPKAYTYVPRAYAAPRGSQVRDDSDNGNQILEKTSGCV